MIDSGAGDLREEGSMECFRISPDDVQEIRVGSLLDPSVTQDRPHIDKYALGGVIVSAG